MTEPLRKCPRCGEPGGLVRCPKCHGLRAINGWTAIDLETANVFAWTEDMAEVANWLERARAGDWGDADSFGIAAVGHDGLVVERLWPESTTTESP